jgi:putative ABC transport system ATP-binding protein
MAEPSIPYVRANAVQREFVTGAGRTPALRNATFALYPADRIALVGPSGSGKSTLLALIAGLDKADHGIIDWPGLRVRRGRPEAVALAFQGASLIPSLNILENTMLPLLLAGQAGSAAEGEARRALALFGVADLSEKLPEQISGGQTQRAALARAVASRPQVLLADEPTGQLDHATGASTMQALLEWGNERACAIIVATHDPVIASRLDTTWTIERGNLEAAAAPQNRSVAGKGEEP